jgi:hypothetical protein
MSKTHIFRLSQVSNTKRIRLWGGCNFTSHLALKYGNRHMISHSVTIKYNTSIIVIKIAYASRRIEEVKNTKSGDGDEFHVVISDIV